MSKSTPNPINWWIGGAFIVIVFAASTGWRILHEETYIFDWDAYMEQVEMVQNGERRYEAIKGDTGALVYPAAHVWIHWGLHDISNWNAQLWTTEVIPKNISGYENRTHRPANVILGLQWGYFGVFCATLIVVLETARVVGVPVWMMALILCTRRVPAIYALGLFNDSWAVLFGALATYCFCVGSVGLTDQPPKSNRVFWMAVGSVFLSLGVGVKMNILLLAPGVLATFLASMGLLETVMCLGICALVQLLIAAPFLAHDPISYLRGAFNLGRAFDQSYSTNFNFVPSDLFSSKAFSMGLLLLHVVVLIWFFGRYFTMFANPTLPSPPKNIQLAFLWIQGANLVGIACARSLHYQFLSWYWWFLPVLLFLTLKSHISHPLVLFLVSFIVMVSLEVAWNQHPPNPTSSAAMTICHIILCSLLLSIPQTQFFSASPKKAE